MKNSLVKLNIDAEIKSYIPPLRPEEYETLEKNIIADGCRDPLVTWNNIIIDGHNRYEICNKNEIPFNFIQKEFENKNNVLNWVIDNQLGRRNLTDNQKTYLIGKRYKGEKREHGGDRKSEKDKSSGQNVHLKKTAQKIAKQYKIDEKTVRRAEKYADAVDTLDKNVSGIKHEILSGTLDITQGDIIKLSKIDIKNQKKVIGKLKTKKVKNVKNALKAIKKEEMVKNSKLQKNRLCKLYNDDFVNVKLDKKIDLILTDPPYPEQYLPEWDKLGKFASENLKENGFLITYSGQIHLPKTISILSKHLNYYWTFCLIHGGGNQLISPRNIQCGWKPILIFQNKIKKLDETVKDIITGSGREKGLHDWQQGEDEVKPIIEKFTIEGETICDPFMGSGSFIKTAINLKRYAIGMEIDKETYAVANARIDGEVNYAS